MADEPPGYFPNDGQEAIPLQPLHVGQQRGAVAQRGAAAQRAAAVLPHCYTDGGLRPVRPAPACSFQTILAGTVGAAVVGVSIALVYIYGLNPGGLSKKEKLERWNPDTLPPIQKSPPWITWKNRTTDHGIPRILLWNSGGTPLPFRTSPRSPIAFPWNRASKYETFTNVTTCTAASKLGRSGRCAVTWDRNLLSESDAVVIYGEHFDVLDLPGMRAVPQMWVFWAPDSPPNASYVDPSLLLSVVPRLFNWTMARRDDSDVRMPYKVWRFRPPPEAAAGAKNEGAPRKSREVAWIANECEQSRAREALKSFGNGTSAGPSSDAANRIKLHIFPLCGRAQCSSPGGCLRRIANAYYFILVELSPGCYQSAYDLIYALFQYRIVPVVLAPPNATLDVPPNSVVSSAELQQPGQLATFLRSLMNDASKYESYFAWKLKCEVLALGDPLCPLCAALWEEPGRPGHRLDLVEWTKRRAICHKEKSLFGLDSSFEEAED